MASIEEKVEKLVEKRIESLGYSLYDVQYCKEGKDYFLRIFIDKENGIDLLDCENVNNGIEDLLDKADYIKEQYFLEISSPGIERVIRKDRHLEYSIGKQIEVSLFKPLNNKKTYEGTLKTYDENTVTLMSEEEIQIERKNISLMKEKFNW